MANSEQQTNGNGSSSRSALQQLPIAAFTTSASGAVIDWNDQMVELTGLSPADVVGKKAWSAFFDKKTPTPVDVALRLDDDAADEDFAVVNRATRETRNVRFLAHPIHEEAAEDPTGAIATLVEGGGVDVASKTRLAVLEAWASGDFSAEYVPKSPKEAAAKASFDKLQSALRRMVDDVTELAAAAGQGNLATRPDTSKHHGDFGRIVGGFNAALDAIVGPVGVCVATLNRISKGDLPPKITEKWVGDFDPIRHDFNTCIESLGGLIGGMKVMSDEHDKGDIDVVMPTDRLQGAYRQLAE